MNFCSFLRRFKCEKSIAIYGIPSMHIYKVACLIAWLERYFFIIINLELHLQGCYTLCCFLNIRSSLTFVRFGFKWLVFVPKWILSKHSFLRRWCKVSELFNTITSYILPFWLTGLKTNKYYFNITSILFPCQYI